MAAVAKNPAFAKKVGIKKSVGEEFLQADKGKTFKGGGMAKACATKSDAKMIAKKEVKGHESSMHKMKKGGMAKGYAKGGIIEKGTGEKYKSKAAMMKHEKKETKAEEMKEHKMKSGGMCGYAKGGGIEKKGKTKGRMI
jgi:hypothetical protein